MQSSKPLVHGRLATVWQRAGARFFDTGIAGALGLFVFLGIIGHRSAADVWLGIRLGFCVGIFVYHFIFECGLAGGQTPGKRLFSISVVNYAGTRLSPLESLSRASALPCLISLFGLPALLLGLLSLLFPFPKRRCFHDVLAGTYVIQTAALNSRYRSVAHAPRGARKVA